MAEIVRAEGNPDSDTGLPLGIGRWLPSRDATGFGELQILGTDTSENTLINAKSGKVTKLMVAKTPVASLQTDGLNFTKALSGPIFPAAAVITPFVTYAAGSAALTGRNNIIAAGAPTSAFVELPAATANVGKTLKLYNQGSNPVAIVPASGVINVSGALTPYSCTTLKTCTCEGLTTGVWGCSSTQ